MGFTNEGLFFATAILNISLVLLASRLGKEFLIGIIVTDLILISTFGAKLITAFGLVTNVGNVFYAAVFLATHMLIELHGKEAGYKTIWIGALSIFVFILLGQPTLLATSLEASTPVSSALQVVFQGAPRVALASMVAFIFAQSINVNLYNFLYHSTRGRMLWLRSNASNVLGQFVDSILFFSIAFFGTISNDILLQSIFAGFLVKVFVGVMGTPFLYFTKVLSVVQDGKDKA